MLKRWIIVTGCVLLAASAASADIPLPEGLQYIDPRVKFEGIEIEGRVFVLKFNTGSGNPFAAPPRYVEVKNSEPFALGAQRRLVNMVLFAVESKEYDKHKDEDKKDWLNDKTTGVLSTLINPPSTVGSVKDKEIPTTRYRVDIANGKLTAEKIAADKKSGAAPGGSSNWIIGLGLALAATAFGPWLVRRRGELKDR